MPLYDCGEPECEECQRAFGPDRRKAIENYRKREAFYAMLEQSQSNNLTHLGRRREISV